jgi:hypothetical protein
MEPDNASLTIVPVLFDGKSWSLYLVNKVWVKDIEFVSLHNLRRRVVMIIVSLVVFVPLISSVNTIEILGLSWSVLVMPPIYLVSTSIS